MTGRGPDPAKDPRMVYADIIDLPHPRSAKHPSMSLYDRAAQFAPFAALSGYDEMIDEEARRTETQIELGESETEQMNEDLARLARLLEEGRKPRCEITRFVPDERKEGGAYVTSREEIRRVDPAARQLILNRKEGYGGSWVTVDLDRILEIRFL